MAYLTAGADLEAIRINIFQGTLGSYKACNGVGDRVCHFDKMDDGESVVCINFTNAIQC